MAADPIERLLRTLLDRERIANTLSAAHRATVRALFERIADIFRDIDPPGAQRSRYKRERTERALAEIQRELRAIAPELEKALRGELARVGRDMAVRARLSLVATLGTEAADLFTPEVGITQQRLRAILTTDPIRGRTLKEHTQTWSASQYNAVRDQIRLGMSAEETTEQITERVLGVKAGFQSDTTGRMRKTGGPGAHAIYRGGVLSKAEREAEAIVRTAVTHVSNVGMMETFKANAEVVTGLRFVATLDSRTSVQCMSYDQVVWPLDSPDIQMPPLHVNCRSIIVPEIGWDALGLPEPPDGTRAARDMRTIDDDELGKRGRGQVEQIPSSVKAEEWLRAQRESVQDHMLGRRRAELFRRGEVSLRDLIRDDNTVIPLDELLN